MSEHGKGITVVGSGSATSTPDLMTVDVGVSVRSESVAESSAGARQHSDTLIEALKGAGIAREDIATHDYAVHPEYDHRDGQQRLLGYRVINELRVLIRDIDRAGSIIDVATSAVGDAVTVNRVHMTLEDERAVRDLAREAAWGDALAKAEHLARLAGRTLGPAIGIVESSGPAVPPRPMRTAMAEATPIEAGTAKTTVSLEVRFGLD